MLEFKEREDRQIKVAGTHPSNCVSDGVPVGGIQAPLGVPVICCVDQFTMGGHVKIATVISPDLDRVGQSKAGDKTFFKEVTVSEAQEIFKSRQGLLKEETVVV